MNTQISLEDLATLDLLVRQLAEQYPDDVEGNMACNCVLDMVAASIRQQS